MTTAYKHETVTGAVVTQSHPGIRTPAESVITELDTMNGHLQIVINTLNDFYQSLCGFPVDLSSQAPSSQPQEQLNGAIPAIEAQLKRLRCIVSDIGTITEEITRV